MELWLAIPLVATVAQASPEADVQAAAEALDDEAWSHYVAGDFAAAEKSARQSLDLRLEKLTKDHPDVSISLGNLGMILVAHGKHDEARALFHRAIEIGRRDPTDLDLAFALDNLAALHSDRGNYADALPLYTQSLTIRRAALGDDPEATTMDVSASLHGLGVLYMMQGWAPVQSVLPDFDRLLVVPDGPISAAPLGALPMADGSYLIERLSVVYLDRANDLLRPAWEGSSRGLLVVGGVDYGAPCGSQVVSSRGAMAPCVDGRFAMLPGTSAEAAALSARWERARKRESIHYLSASEATESAVSAALSGKAIAHLSTHGFFATGRCRSAIEGDGIGFDPLLLSGLVLAGANQPLDPMVDDGILTAAEVVELDLSDTGLVVLSACETGLGEIPSGEGVLGLRRAFAIAGAHSLIMSLWSVSDETTTVLMDALYRRHLHRRKPMNPADALRAAQLEVLGDQRSLGQERPQEWAAFIASGIPPE